ncbi:MAG: hypothetical protein J5617_03920 [Bacilli bacterium]|nr:hypothetical protein [Bacilli bacterium]
MDLYLVVVMFFKGMVFNGRRYYVFEKKEDAINKMVCILAEEARQLLEGEDMDLEIIKLKEGDDHENIIYKGNFSRNEEYLDAISV